VFVTMCDLTVEPDRRTAHLTVAGHPSPVLLRPALVELESGLRGPALGIVPEGRWPVETLELPPEWSLMLYTDGLIEGRVPDSTSRLGTEGLLELLAPQRVTDLHDLAEGLIAEAEKLNRGPLPDDVALLVVSHLAGRTGIDPR
jgi:serine phosphatase RsbU (regulator of sigma subunit)